MNLDTRLSRSVHEATKKSWLLRHLAVFCADDLIWLMIGVVYGVALWGVPHTASRFLLVALMLWLGLFVPWVITSVISRIVKRPRPYTKQKYEPIIKPFIETHSFPSSHATFVFALAFMSINSDLFVCVLVAAVLVALGRVAVGVHYFSDVVAGALVGLLGGKLFPIIMYLVTLTRFDHLFI
ncbi:MAG: phosphatase PAP2 family protein [Parcubacteria group bacterium]|nr:phosphatase PAP2 family protein [Parcubacteria group bacterium]